MREHLYVEIRLLTLDLTFLEVLDIYLVEHGESQLRMIRRFLVFLEVRVDGANVEMCAGCRGPILDLVDLNLQCFFEIAQGHLRLVVPA